MQLVIEEKINLKIILIDRITIRIIRLIVNKTGQLLNWLKQQIEHFQMKFFPWSITHRITVEHPEDQFCVSNVTSSSTNCVHACGDSIFSRGRIQNRNYSDEDISRVRSSSKKRNTIPKKSIFGLNVAQPQNSQSTQTTDKIFYKNNQKWLIRRTRSGHIYGKYPI